MLFIPCCEFTLTQEAGFCNIKGDPGGATNHGITIRELSSVLGRPATVADVQALTEAQAEAIYKPRYWDVISGDKLPAGVDLMVFDFGVTAGPEISAKLLQRLIGVEEDGDIGPETLQALTKRVASNVISGLYSSHEVYYESLASFSQFGVGWLARLSRCQTQSLVLHQNIT